MIKLTDKVGDGLEGLVGAVREVVPAGGREGECLPAPVEVGREDHLGVLAAAEVQLAAVSIAAGGGRGRGGGCGRSGGCGHSCESGARGATSSGCGGGSSAAIVVAAIVAAVAAVASIADAGGDKSFHFIFGGVFDDQELCEDTTIGGVIEVVAGVASTSWVAEIARGKSARVESVKWVAADQSDLDGEFERDGFVGGRCPVRGRVLVLGDEGNLRVHGLDRRAERRFLAHRASVALQGAVDQGADLAVKVVFLLGVGEGAVGGGLLETVGVGDFALAG